MGALSAWWEVVPLTLTVVVVVAGICLLVWAAVADGRENDLAHGIRRRAGSHHHRRRR